MTATPTANATCLRAERISAEYIPQLAHIHVEAFAGYMNARLGLGYARALLTWFASQDDAIALAATDESGPLGYVVGAPLGYTRALNRDLMPAAIIGAIAHPGLLLDKRFLGVAMGRLRLLTGAAKPAPNEPDLPAPTISLVGIGVASKARGKGAGAVLMKSFETEAIRLRMGSMRLSVYPENAVARKVYEAAGWVAGPLPLRPNTAMFYSKVIG